MSLTLHHPHPGVVLVVTDRGSVLLGAPADAFKATKRLCATHDVPFPRVLVAPQKLLTQATPQFNPEFFLYEFLFVYGAAFKPELADERLALVLDSEQVDGIIQALRITLTGPTRDELAGYQGEDGRPILPPQTVSYLARVGSHMAIRKGEAIRQIDDMVAVRTFDGRGSVELLGGSLKVTRDGPTAFIVRAADAQERVDLSFSSPLVPFSTLPPPTTLQRPTTFGVKLLGTRSGFDLSGPTTGFVIWVNGHAVVYDGPVGTTYLLRQQGMSVEDVGGVILSHCHEDHMGAFIELLLTGHRPKVFTTEPIYRSALVKLAAFFGRSREEVATYLDYQEVRPGEPTEIFGALFAFFYTVHAIPTIGTTVTMRVGGADHRIQISGDTMGHDGLDRMHGEGVLTFEQHRAMKHLVPNERQENSLYLADVGEAIIHGHPKDWAGNPNNIVYYHCADSPATRAHGHRVGDPGESLELIIPRSVHPLVPARLLDALRAFAGDDPGWITQLLYRGHVREAAPGAVLVEEDAVAADFAVILSGVATLSTQEGGEIADLGPRDYFGLIELITSDGTQRTRLTAKTPLEYFAIDGRAFYDHVTRHGLERELRNMWQNRIAVDAVRVLRQLDMATRDLLAAAGVREIYADGAEIMSAGSADDRFFLLLSGTVRLQGEARTHTICAGDEDAFFGESVAHAPVQVHTATAFAKGRVEVVSIDGADTRRILSKCQGFRYAIELARQER